MGLPVWQPAAMVAGLTRPYEVLQARTQYQDFDIYWLQRFAYDTPRHFDTVVNKAKQVRVGPEEEGDHRQPPS